MPLIPQYHRINSSFITRTASCIHKWNIIKFKFISSVFRTNALGYVMTISEVLEIGELSWILLGGLSLICCTYAFIMKDNEDDEDDLIAEDNV